MIIVAFFLAVTIDFRTEETVIIRVSPSQGILTWLLLEAKELDLNSRFQEFFEIALPTIILFMFLDWRRDFTMSVGRKCKKFLDYSINIGTLLRNVMLIDLEILQKKQKNQDI